MDIVAVTRTKEMFLFIEKNGHISSNEKSKGMCKSIGERRKNIKGHHFIH